MITLHLNPQQFVVIMELLQNIRLGSRNEFEDEISNLVINLEKNGLEQMFFHLKDAMNMPDFSVEVYDRNSKDYVINIA